MRNSYTRTTPIVTFTNIYYIVSDGVIRIIFESDPVTDREYIGCYRNRFYSICVAVYLYHANTICRHDGYHSNNDQCQ